jgi:hypothetical protein
VDRDERKRLADNALLWALVILIGLSSVAGVVLAVRTLF